MSGFHLDLYDLNGERRAILDSEVLSLNYQTQVNQPAQVTFVLAGDHEMAKTIVPGWRCDVWRLLETNEWRKEVVSFVESSDWQFTDRPEISFTAAGALSMLSKRIVAYFANVDNRSKFEAVSPETIAITLLNYNIGASATVANGRMVNGANGLISIPVSQNRGTPLDWFCHWENLLTTLQKLAKAGSFDFDLAPAGNQFVFVYYPNQMGIDRTATTVFSLERGNVANIHDTLSVSESANIVIVGGKGEDSDRQVKVVQQNLIHGLFDAEVFLEATDAETEDGLITRGNQELEELSAISKFEFEILQSADSKWNINYFLGDLVSVVSPLRVDRLTAKIDSATVTFESDGSETIRIGVVS